MKVWKDEEYFGRDVGNFPPAWAVNLVVGILIVLLIVAGIKLIDARRQLKAIETAVRDCQKGTIGNFTFSPDKTCDKVKNPSLVIKWEGK